MTAIISVKLTDAQFEGQTKAKLGNASIRTLVSNIVTQQLAEFLEENPAAARAKEIEEPAYNASLPRVQALLRQARGCV